jgi:hypothetical protein
VLAGLLKRPGPAAGGTTAGGRSRGTQPPQALLPLCSIRARNQARARPRRPGSRWTNPGLPSSPASIRSRPTTTRCSRWRPRIERDVHDGPLLGGPCEITVDLLAGPDGEIDSYRALLRPDAGESAPWLASDIQRVFEHRDSGLDAAGIIRHFAQLASSLLAWHQERGPASPPQASTIAGAVSELTASAQREGLRPHHLEGIVFEEYARLAGRISSGGLESRIRFLVQTYGRAAAESLIVTCLPPAARQRPQDSGPELQ